MNTAEGIIYARLLANWPKADAILALSLMDIADEIADDLRAAGLVASGPHMEKP